MPCSRGHASGRLRLGLTRSDRVVRAVPLELEPASRDPEHRGDVVMRHSSAFRRNNAYYLRSDSRMMNGVWLAGPPYIKLDLPASSQSIADAVHQVLAASRVGIVDPGDSDDDDFPLLELAGVKSWVQFMKGARCVSIRTPDGVLSLRSYRAGGRALCPLMGPLKSQVMRRQTPSLRLWRKRSPDVSRPTP